VHEQVKLLAALAQSAHLDGVVCSPYEIAMLREHGPQYQYTLGRCGYSWGSIRHLMLLSTTWHWFSVMGMTKCRRLAGKPS